MLPHVPCCEEQLLEKFGGLLLAGLTQFWPSKTAFLPLANSLPCNLPTLCHIQCGLAEFPLGFPWGWLGAGDHYHAIELIL